jgi:hypothetical protein
MFYIQRWEHWITCKQPYVLHNVPMIAELLLVSYEGLPRITGKVEIVIDLLESHVTED